MARLVGSLGTIDTLTVGGRVMTDMTNLKILSCIVNVGTFSSYRRVNQNSGGAYTPSGATAFHVKGVRSSNTGSISNFGNVYGDNDVGFFGGGPTNPIYEASGNSTNSVGMAALAGISEHPSNFILPNGKYLSGYFNYNGGAWVFGYEV
jgi:hypothetical protein